MYEFSAVLEHALLRAEAVPCDGALRRLVERPGPRGAAAAAAEEAAPHRRLAAARQRPADVRV